MLASWGIILGDRVMTSLVTSSLVYSLLIVVIIGSIYWHQKHKSMEPSSADCQAAQVELYRQTTYLIGELKMEMDELRGALATAQSEAEALKAANVELTARLAVASKVPDDVAAQVNTLVATLAP